MISLVCNCLDEHKMAYYGFDPKTTDGITYGLERFEEILTELEPLHRSHWDETEGYNDKPFKPDYEGLIHLEKLNMLLQFTAREPQGAIIGHLAYRLSHTYQCPEHLRAHEEVFYVVPEWRKTRARVSLHLINYAEYFMRELGVTMVSHTDKSPVGGAKMENFFKRMGYKPVYISYMKNISEKEDVR